MADFKTPEDLKYQTTDEWLRVDGETGIIGITDYAQDALNDLAYVELPDVGATLAAGEQFGTVESVKATAELLMPVAGEVIEVNSELEDTPETINSSPYEDGWIIKVKITGDMADGLMDAAAYAKYCEDR